MRVTVESSPKRRLLMGALWWCRSAGTAGRTKSWKGSCTRSIVAAAIALITLLAAILGGIAGMRFHRKVDKTGLGR